MAGLWREAERGDTSEIAYERMETLSQLPVTTGGRYELRGKLIYRDVQGGAIIMSSKFEADWMNYVGVRATRMNMASTPKAGNPANAFTLNENTVIYVAKQFSCKREFSHIVPGLIFRQIHSLAFTQLDNHLNFIVSNFLLAEIYVLRGINAFGEQAPGQKLSLRHWFGYTEAGGNSGVQSATVPGVENRLPVTLQQVSPSSVLGADPLHSVTLSPLFTVRNPLGSHWTREQQYLSPVKLANFCESLQCTQHNPTAPNLECEDDASVSLPLRFTAA
ncbi:Hypothetical predicted protein [Scomber scombrus]|uniref:Uncharacterized protein n=1 Tax=Scomber scombrus TaxID=13677 RepID=A0AAV1MQT3_SCOSC